MKKCITRNMVKIGYDNGLICLDWDSNFYYSTVCWIGGFWFYFDGERADDVSPEEYKKLVPKSEIIDLIYDALEELRFDDYEDEYLYYYYYLKDFFK